MAKPDEVQAGLRACRLMKGLTLGEVSVGTGIETRRIRNIETGVARPAVDEVGAIWKFLSTGEPSLPAPRPERVRR